MKVRTIFFFVILSIIVLFSTTCFATEEMINDAMEGVENTMEDVGNVVEDTANGMVTGVKDSMDNMGNTMNDMGNAVMDTMDMGDDNYTAERTATTNYSNEGTFLGLNSTAWTWIIVGIVGITLVGLVIYYNTQRDYDRNRSRNRDDF